MHTNTTPFIGLVLLLITSCSTPPSTTQTPINQDTIISNNQLPPQNSHTKPLPFQPDTSINHKLKLENRHSLKDFHPAENIEAKEYLVRLFPAAFFTNKDQTQYLCAYQYYGGIQNVFSQFEIGYVDATLEAIPLIRTDYPTFFTETGIKLGITLEKLISIKGKAYEKRTSPSGNTMISYKIEGNNKHEGRYDYTYAFLARYRMPSYILNYELENNKVIKITFGFEYP